MQKGVRQLRVRVVVGFMKVLTFIEPVNSSTVFNSPLVLADLMVSVCNLLLSGTTTCNRPVAKSKGQVGTIFGMFMVA